MAISDAESLSLIEHYKWAVSPQVGGGWVIEDSDRDPHDAEVVLLCRTRGTLRDAIQRAIANKFKWSQGQKFNPNDTKD